MKKIVKTAIFAFAVVAAGFGSVRAYQSISTNNENILLQNVDALSNTSEGTRWSEKSFKCTKPEYKSMIICESGGEDYCYPSDC